jgi:hypothetical protein
MNTRTRQAESKAKQIWARAASLRGGLLLAAGAALALVAAVHVHAA